MSVCLCVFVYVCVCVSDCVGGVEGWVDKVQQLKIISLLFVRRSLSFWITGAKKKNRGWRKKGERTQVAGERAPREGKMDSLLSPRQGETMALLYGTSIINHSRPTFVYTFWNVRPRKHTVRVVYIPRQRRATRAAFNKLDLNPTLSRATQTERREQVAWNSWG